LIKVGVQPHQLGLFCLNSFQEFSPISFKGEQFRLHARGPEARFDGVYDGADFSVHSSEFLCPLSAIEVIRCGESVKFAVVFSNKLTDQFWTHQMHLKAAKDTRLEHVTPNAQKVCPCTTVMGSRACVVRVAAFREAAAAHSAAEQTGQKV